MEKKDIDKAYQKKFLKFLKNNKIAKQYRINLVKSFINDHYKVDNKVNLILYPLPCVINVERHNYFNELINHAFFWGKTNEGREFWANIDDKWRVEAKKILKQYE